MENRIPIKIAFDPDLNMSPIAFSEAWNISPSHREVAKSQVDTADSTQFLDPALASAGLVALGSIATGLLTNALWDLIKELLVEQGVTKKTTYRELTLPDGTKLLIISVEETK